MIWANLLHIYQPPHWDARVIERVVRESYRPLVGILSRHPQVRVTLNINASLTEQLVRLGYHDVINGLRLLAERGQIELTGSAKYHPILPLLPAEEIRRQIHLNTETNRSIFGDCYAPSGFFPPEMAVDLGLINIIAELGFTWVAVDEISSQVNGFTDLSQRQIITPPGLTAIMRNRNISDYLSFTAPPDDPRATLKAITEEGRHSPALVTAFDGENLGHHRPGTDQLWEKLVTAPAVETITYQQLIVLFERSTSLSLQPSSWSARPQDLANHAPYPLWHHPDNPIHQQQWSLTRLVIDAVNSAKSDNDPGYELARHQLDEALASDQYWWASATPWWSVEIIIAGVERFKRVLEHLTVVPPDEKRRAQGLITSITETTQHWQADGTAAKRREIYLKSTATVRYLGGQRIDSDHHTTID